MNKKKCIRISLCSIALIIFGSAVMAVSYFTIHNNNYKQQALQEEKTIIPNWNDHTIFNFLDRDMLIEFEQNKHFPFLKNNQQKIYYNKQSFLQLNDVLVSIDENDLKQDLLFHLFMISKQNDNKFSFFIDDFDLSYNNKTKTIENLTLQYRIYNNKTYNDWYMIDNDSFNIDCKKTLIVNYHTQNSKLDIDVFMFNNQLTMGIVLKDLEITTSINGINKKHKTDLSISKKAYSINSQLQYNLANIVKLQYDYLSLKSFDNQLLNYQKNNITSDLIKAKISHDVDYYLEIIKKANILVKVIKNNFSINEIIVDLLNLLQSINKNNQELVLTNRVLNIIKNIFVNATNIIKGLEQSKTDLDFVFKFYKIDFINTNELISAIKNRDFDLILNTAMKIAPNKKTFFSFLIFIFKENNVVNSLIKYQKQFIQLINELMTNNDLFNLIKHDLEQLINEIIINDHYASSFSFVVNKKSLLLIFNILKNSHIIPLNLYDSFNFYFINNSNFNYDNLIHFINNINLVIDFFTNNIVYYFDKDYFFNKTANKIAFNYKLHFYLKTEQTKILDLSLFYKLFPHKLLLGQKQYNKSLITTLLPNKLTFNKDDTWYLEIANCSDKIIFKPVNNNKNTILKACLRINVKMVLNLKNLLTDVYLQYPSSISIGFKLINDLINNFVMPTWTFKSWINFDHEIINYKIDYNDNLYINDFEIDFKSDLKNNLDVNYLNAITYFEQNHVLTITNKQLFWTKKYLFKENKLVIKHEKIDELINKVFSINSKIFYHYPNFINDFIDLKIIKASATYIIPFNISYNLKINISTPFAFLTEFENKKILTKKISLFYDIANSKITTKIN